LPFGASSTSECSGLERLYYSIRGRDQSSIFEANHSNTQSRKKFSSMQSHLQ